MKHQSKHILFNAAVIVAALGYFVDIYDLLLFSVVRIPSLIALGIPSEEITSKGLLLLNVQMAGMLIGGVFWGILGDKKGRVSTLFGSILLYSIANAFVQTVDQYAVLRFIAGIGLAGELGVGITLVSEILPKETRGYGTMIVAGIGVTGAILANFVAKFDWRIAFFVGGIMGFSLLLLRIKVSESSMFSDMHAQKSSSIKKGSFVQLLSTPALLKKFLYCILIGMPTWFVVGILVTLAPEFAKQHGIMSGITGGDAVAFCYAGLAIGDFLTGWLSQKYQSRKKVMKQFLVFNIICVIGYLLLPFTSVAIFYGWIFLLGISVGFWAIFVTIAAEQFGTNLRATVATTVPNIARGSLNIISITFATLIPILGMKFSALSIGLACTVIALLALIPLKETFAKDLNYTEH